MALDGAKIADFWDLMESLFGEYMDDGEEDETEDVTPSTSKDTASGSSAKVPEESKSLEVVYPTSEDNLLNWYSPWAAPCLWKIAWNPSSLSLISVTTMQPIEQQCVLILAKNTCKSD